ncbi:unnamed protein product [Staurois parvus]|uniref:Uncharacterized protein n=1 Tax=Staurois parvus TaxID=386267 RepID=A0ABN9APJ2_9NEOB|nr:unnamed protein product [Staurois parvus]
MLNHCMVLATMLQVNFRVLAIFLYPKPSLCRATILFFQILRELFAMRCHVELPVTSMRE